MAKKKKKDQTEQQKRSTRQARLRATCDRLQVPLVLAVQLLAGTLKEADLVNHSDSAVWRAEYQEEAALRQSDEEVARQLKQRQIEQIIRTFGATKQDALAVFEGVIDPAELPTRRRGLLATCERLKVPAVVAAQILAGILNEAVIEQRPQRDCWHTEYQEEVALGRVDAKKLKSRRANQIASAFDVPNNIARQVLNGKTTPAELVQMAQARAHKRQEEALRKRQEEWLGQGVTALQGLGLPEGMARALLNLPSKKQSWWIPAMKVTPLPIDLNASPSDTVVRYWLEVLHHSGFTAPEALIDAWQGHQVWTVESLRRAEQRQTRQINAGMLPGQITTLCVVEHIEDTLHKLFFLNHWAKARDRLLYADRQGLYQVKARLLQEAYQAGHIRAISYVSSSAPFVPFGESVWVDGAVEWFLEALWESFSEHPNDEHSEMARQLYLRMTGQEATPEEVEKLDPLAIEAYIRRRLEELEATAVATRCPIPVSELQALFLSPDDLPNLVCNENGDYRLGRFSPNWDDLDEGDLRVLDPESLSLIGFRYESPTAHYTFHLPLRVAEQFMIPDQIETLRSTTERTREAGEFYGREITEAESLAYPIHDLLAELGVEIALVCPQELVDKDEYISEKNMARSLYYYGQYDDWDDNDDDEDFADYYEDEFDYFSPPQQKKRRQNRQRRLDSSPTCPLCGAKIEAASRLAHWQETHPEVQAVTVSRAAWLMGLSRLELEALNITPDYRDESNARHWRLETLKEA